MTIIPLRQLLPFMQLLLLMVTSAICGPGSAASVSDLAHLRVKDPHFGEALFYAYQGNYLSAMAHLGAFKKMHQLPMQEEDSDLLMGVLQFSYGMENEAKESLSKLLLNKKLSQKTSDIAAFYLAHIHYNQGTLTEANRIISLVRDPLPARLEKEKDLLKVNYLIAQSQYQEAAKILSSVDDGDEATIPKRYAQHNLGVALLRHGQLQQGISVLKKISAESLDDLESRTLQDKANLALGYIQLQSGDANSAIEFFEKIRITGLFSSKALLGLGLAETALDRHQRALIPWLELQKGDVIEREVQEVLLMIPEALFKLESYKKSQSDYLLAISRYTSEIVDITAAIAQLREGAAKPSTLANSVADGHRGNYFSGKLSIEKETRYLGGFMRDAGFQQAASVYQEALALRSVMVTQKERLKSYGLSPDSASRYADRISENMDEVDKTLSKLEFYIQNLAIDFLEKKKTSLSSYLSQANLGLAKVYHHAAERELNR